jgi:hypothetical protein
MRIESVANERNMSESSSKESSSKRGPKRRFTDSERKHRKRESNAKLGKSRIWINSNNTALSIGTIAGL